MEDDEVAASLWERLLELALAFGLCASCHFTAALEGGIALGAWTCPRCGFQSSGDPEAWGPVSRNQDPVGADEPRHDGRFDPEDDEGDDADWMEPDLAPAMRDKPTR